MKSVIVKDRQNIIDLAIQYYGSAAAVITLCQDNNLELDDDIPAGTTLLLQDTYPDTADADYADYIQSAGIVVVTDSGVFFQTALGTNDDEFIVTNNDNYIQA